MKINRRKKVSNHLNFYKNTFHFREPYQILIDGTFCFASLQNKMKVEEVGVYLMGELKFLTTQCVYIETENLGKKVQGALLILKKYPVHKCGHEKKPIPGAQCLFSMIKENNKNHYFVATQDMDLQNRLRQVPGVPLMYLHGKTPVLEQPSIASLKSAKGIVTLGEYERETVAELRAKHGIVEEEEKPKRRKKKKGPNPLSCKKKKKIGSIQQNKISEKEDSKVEADKKRRKKIRIPQHIKDELLESVNKK